MPNYTKKQPPKLVHKHSSRSTVWTYLNLGYLKVPLWKHFIVKNIESEKRVHQYTRKCPRIYHDGTIEWSKLPSSQLCTTSMQCNDRIQFNPLPQHFPTHKEYSYFLSFRSHKEPLQTHDSCVKLNLPTRSDWLSNFLKNYPQTFYRESFLKLIPSTPPHPVCAHGQS